MRKLLRIERHRAEEKKSERIRNAIKELAANLQFVCEALEG